jgi:iron complex outermembrane receptor protein
MKRGAEMNGFGARNTKKHGLLVGASVLVLAAGGQAFAQDSKPDDATVAEVVVTGTRIVSSVNAISPTPVMAVSAEQLAQTTPSNIPEGLNKLPVFQGSTQPRRPGGGGGGSIAQNVLNLRGFGTQRTLVLVDGHRVAPTNPEGTTDIDTIPQMLISRIDVTTGGASAVYGSDAVTGVVNFVLDKNFTGLKFETNAGISKYGDGGSGKVGLAAGRAILGGKGHFEGSIEYRHQDSVPIIARPDGAKVYVRTGNGSAAASLHGHAERSPEHLQLWRPCHQLRRDLPRQRHELRHRRCPERFRGRDPHRHGQYEPRRRRRLFDLFGRHRQE